MTLKIYSPWAIIKRHENDAVASVLRAEYQRCSGMFNNASDAKDTASTAVIIYSGTAAECISRKYNSTHTTTEAIPTMIHITATRTGSRKGSDLRSY